MHYYHTPHYYYTNEKLAFDAHALIKRACPLRWVGLASFGMDATCALSRPVAEVLELLPCMHSASVRPRESDGFACRFALSTTGAQVQTPVAHASNLSALLKL